MTDLKCLFLQTPGGLLNHIKGRPIPPLNCSGSVLQLFCICIIIVQKYREYHLDLPNGNISVCVLFEVESINKTSPSRTKAFNSRIVYMLTD